ncbi:Uncharacterised protein [Mycobacteroides abscessus subsp. bolletii]|nr:Uncharacterised protein [Mycobacteroides abscessus subsp. bolletii]SKH25850.1 Uncharacterised protein [Mycobacteroides abscessus subsp. bolletii]SKH60409.1 Uncharacterised protein [Mycobacteroides abscessus subsp. bolletii]
MRKAADTMSAMPPITRKSSASHSSGACAVRPNPTIARPHTTMLTTTAKPWRSIRWNHPENTPPMTAPTDIAADNSAITVPPSAGSPNPSCAICGNRMRGIPKTMATRSTTNDISTILCPARYRNPSSTS